MPFPGRRRRAGELGAARHPVDHAASVHLVPEGEGAGAGRVVRGKLRQARSSRTARSRDRTDYYRAVLQNLFFAILNTEIDKRAFSKKTRTDHRDSSISIVTADLLADPDDFIDMLRSVPFVNGGLFDCLDDFAGVKKGGRRIDAFTDNISTQGRDLGVPGSPVSRSRRRPVSPCSGGYKFTVEENTPLDREVALDPELLGRVFENLLAAYNPETRETVRRATGSYYTPRHIVDYMVDEALAAGLAEKSRPTDGATSISGASGCATFSTMRDAFDDAGELFGPDETENVVRAIAEIAGAGSGGRLRRLPHGRAPQADPGAEAAGPRQRALGRDCRRNMPAGRRARRSAFEDDEAREEELLDISKTFETYRDSDFGRKLYLIQNGIFGVDIQPVACQIAKLRFFISLAVEQQANDDPSDNYGIRPLPNLETRFVAADTLLGLGAKKQEVLGSDVVRTLENRLRRVRERYFNARTRGTKAPVSRKQDVELRD